MMKFNGKEVMLQAEGIGICYKKKAGLFKSSEFWPVENISFRVFKGETLGVIGRNGAGKSSLLRVLAGIMSPDRGKLINFGVTSSLLSLQAGFVPHLSGKENILLGGMLLGMPKQTVLSKMSEIEAYADIGDFINEPVAHYSSGMAARLGFAIAIYADPDVILLDEILGVGDADFQRKSSETMREKINSDKTVVLVSHQLDVIEHLTDRVVWIEGGRVRTIGGTKDVVEAYRDQIIG